MSTFCKYYKEVRQVSYDSGQTWENLNEYRKGDLYETESVDCGGGITQYRWVNVTGQYTCVGTTKYQKTKKQQSTDGGNTWTDVSPIEYSTGAVIEYNSSDCGYVQPQYRTTSGTPYCSGYDKYVDVYSQVSYDSGSTWTTTATTNTMVEHNSQDCGYVPPAYSAQYLTFVATQSGTFKFNGTSGNSSIQYSLDSGTTWNTLASSASSPTVTSGNKIMWKGNLNPIQEEEFWGDNGIGVFEANHAFTVEGNIMSLLYGDNFANKTSLSGKNFAFRCLFQYNSYLTDVQNLILPATTLSNNCYSGMFQGCSSLTTAPILSATTLTRNCYTDMFAGCSSLTTAPQLLATTMVDSCYSGMFLGCTSLATAPQLPATTLAENCYGLMFQSCTSLTVAPQLPATTLADFCYYEMFGGCSSLTTAPILSATTLVTDCYELMFNDCSSLNYVKCLATNTNTDWTSSWLRNVSSTGTFVKANGTSWPSGANGIPNNWTIQNA